MDVEEYIASGILELYVAGALSPEENLEVQHYAIQYPEIRKEIEAIERAILELTEAASPKMPQDGFAKVKAEINDVIPFTPQATSSKGTSWGSYLGWAASILLAIGLFWMYMENSKLKSEIELTNQEKQSLEDILSNTQEEITSKETLLQEIRDRNVAVVALGGQTVSPESYAKVYWNKEENKVIIDAQGLPEPPDGFTYQVWSLKLDPLTPTSLGLLDGFASQDTKLFTMENVNESEAFGITLEPEGGSETPTLEQLYTLGAVGS
ncbi:Anti-sigma-K factor RskA [Allomuricauda ruestringensis DSM 13258]|uniref:Anti-sigma-K factor RskA n=1 Tax=Allomuricauda ruestringensis (strain DSM 13258 / CIP 107369 / LMG 19739 / B1) TaxID=886377 RepID=G2PR41_ALLRU|nr:anti-sigma factor [Allomuricauda ruestringensis]AEM69173.1 Anti-sigma-K factor RskA [Allomuricauda ruestringensis DSM 13258]